MARSGVFLLVLSVLLSGCSVKKEMIPLGGSKADGTVKMGYEVGEFEKPIIDPNQAATLAAQKCKVWGYEGAEAFGGQMTTCVQPGGMSGCVRSNVTVDFQCVGGKAAQN